MKSESIDNLIAAAPLLTVRAREVCYSLLKQQISETWELLVHLECDEESVRLHMLGRTFDGFHAALMGQVEGARPPEMQKLRSCDLEQAPILQSFLGRYIADDGSESYRFLAIDHEAGWASGGLIVIELLLKSADSIRPLVH